MRKLFLHCATIGVLVSSVPNIVWAGSTGRRNTAIAATALAAGAWMNGTGRAGRRNTAILATGGAAYAWSRYAKKKKEERRHAPVALGRGRPVSRQLVYAPAGPGRGRKLGHYKHHGGGHGHYR